MNETTVCYNDRVVRQFALASLAWGAVALAAGVVAAGALLFGADVPAPLSFGRMRPVHVHLAVFAFAGNIVFAGVYYSSQRMLEARLPSRLLAETHFWGWQLMIAVAAITLLLGYQQGRGAAPVEWPIDLLTAALWLLFAVNFFSLVRRRNRDRLHVALWFYIAAIVALAAVHLVNLLVIPVGWMTSYPIVGGALDALLGAWAESGLKSFLLTAPVIGLLYYLVPQAAARPLFSHRLAVAHFWAFLFVASWLAPQRLLFAAVPDWLQAVGLAFGLLLWVPAWAGMLGGLLTMRGAGSRLLRDPVLGFCAAAWICLGLAALEAPLLGAGAVSVVTGYTDWMHGRSHLGTMGGVGLLAAALLYWMVPRLQDASLHSLTAARVHLRMAVVGLVLYVGATWLAGATQGVLLHSQDAAGGMRYEFLDTLAALDLAYAVRMAGGKLYLAGFAIMIWNLARTVAAGRPEAAEAAVIARAPSRALTGLRELLLAPPVMIAAIAVALLVAAGVADFLAALASVFLAGCIGLAGFVVLAAVRPRQGRFHARLEGHALALTLLVAGVTLHGGAIQVTALAVATAAPSHDGSAGAMGGAAYTGLELEGRDVYRREGCASCHTQMVRPLLPEVARYGQVTAAAGAHERPALWGSRRVGPDLARAGGRRSDAWHIEHLIDPRAVVPGSRMPSYQHLAQRRVDLARLPRKLRALAALGLPYRREDIEGAGERAQAQGAAISLEVGRSLGIELDPTSEIIALVAYLQRLGDGAAPVTAGEAGAQSTAGEKVEP